MFDPRWNSSVGPTYIHRHFCHPPPKHDKCIQVSNPCITPATHLKRRANWLFLSWSPVTMLLLELFKLHPAAANSVRLSLEPLSKISSSSHRAQSRDSSSSSEEAEDVQLALSLLSTLRISAKHLEHFLWVGRARRASSWMKVNSVWLRPNRQPQTVRQVLGWPVPAQSSTLCVLPRRLLFCTYSPLGLLCSTRGREASQSSNIAGSGIVSLGRKASTLRSRVSSSDLAFSTDCFADDSWARASSCCRGAEPI